VCLTAALSSLVRGLSVSWLSVQQHSCCVAWQPTIPVLQRVSINNALLVHYSAVKPGARPGSGARSAGRLGSQPDRQQHNCFVAWQLTMLCHFCVVGVSTAALSSLVPGLLVSWLSVQQHNCCVAWQPTIPVLQRVSNNSALLVHCSAVKPGARPGSGARSAGRLGSQPDRPTSGASTAAAAAAATARSPIPIFEEAGSLSRRSRVTAGSVGGAAGGSDDDEDEGGVADVAFAALPGFGAAVRGGAAAGSAAAAAEGARGVLVKDILEAEQQLQVGERQMWLNVSICHAIEPLSNEPKQHSSRLPTEACASVLACCCCSLVHLQLEPPVALAGCN
jgi:hypothetical protein